MQTPFQSHDHLFLMNSLQVYPSMSSRLMLRYLQPRPYCTSKGPTYLGQMYSSLALIPHFWYKVQIDLGYAGSLDRCIDCSVIQFELSVSYSLLFITCQDLGDTLWSYYEEWNVSNVSYKQCNMTVLAIPADLLEYQIWVICGIGSLLQSEGSPFCSYFTIGQMNRL